MDRRTVLLGLAGLTAGCSSVLPEATPQDADVRRNPPTLLCAGRWNGSQVTLTVTAGNRLTAANTERLTVYGDTALADWVGGANASQPFPLEPGDSITVSLENREDRVRLVWRDADGGGSSTLCRSERPEADGGGS